MASKSTLKNKPLQLNKPLLKLIALHLSLMGVVGSCIVLLFFQFLLPVITHHGQFITVPTGAAFQ